MAEPRFRTIDLARAVGISAQAVRDYETWGLLPAVERLANGYRQYTTRHLLALRAARALLEAGYTREEAVRVMRSVHTGDIDTALAVIDAHHAWLDAQRHQLTDTAATIQRLVSAPSRTWDPADRDLTIGEAAAAVGVRPSAVRYWEEQGLLRPPRRTRSGYRIYDREHLVRLTIVAWLRSMDEPFESIRDVMRDLAPDRPAPTPGAIARRQRQIAHLSRASTEATARLWALVELMQARPAAGEAGP